MVFYGRTGPRQGCDPLPYLDLVRANYPPDKVGLFYGGDYGLRYPEIRHHVQDHRNVGFIFMREVEEAPTMTFKPECLRFFRVIEIFVGLLCCWNCISASEDRVSTFSVTGFR